METILSVIVPVYRVEDYLEKCVSSVTQQEVYRRGQVEIILVDDGSPDASGAICDRLSAGEEHVVVIHKENGGLSSARNAGIRAAKGTYLLFLDSDDTLLPDALENIVAMLTTRPDVLLCHHVEENALDGSRWEDDTLLDRETVAALSGEALLNYLATDRMYNWYAWLNVVKRAFLLEHELFFTEGKNFEDVLWTQPLLLNAKTVDYLQVPMYCYVVNRGGSITRQISERVYGDKFNALQFTENFCRDKGFSEDTTVKLLANLSQIYVSLLADGWLLKPSVRKAYRKKLQKYTVCLKYATQSYKRILYKAKPLIGLWGISLVLYARAQYVRKKNHT